MNIQYGLYCAALLHTNGARTVLETSENCTVESTISATYGLVTVYFCKGNKLPPGSVLVILRVSDNSVVRQFNPDTGHWDEATNTACLSDEEFGALRREHERLTAKFNEAAWRKHLQENPDKAKNLSHFSWTDLHLLSRNGCCSPSNPTTGCRGVQASYSSCVFCGEEYE